eukprot:gene1429-4590_t
MDESLHILLGCTGSVASIKVPDVVEALQSISTSAGRKLEVKIVATASALHFVQKESLTSTVVYTDSDEWETWKCIGDPVLHIELRNWAHVFVVAPLDANTLAKISTGICDNLLTCVARAWNFDDPMLVCPAMNTLMWEHPITDKQIDVLRSWGVSVIDPIRKRLACGDFGPGAMATPESIRDVVASCLSSI